MIKRDWVRQYDTLPVRTPSTYVLQSYDTASKPGEGNDWSVCTTWYVIDGKYYLVDVLRGQYEYPDLKKLAIDHAQTHRPTKILVEDSGIGPALVSALEEQRFAAVPVKVEHDKRTRMAIQAAKFESGKVFLPRQAPWLPDLEAELFSFPTSRHDDQVDSISQALAHETNTALWTRESNAGFQKFTEGLYTAALWRRHIGQPW
jgi:predicted phage terminase large subunit-like protein